MLCYGVVAQRVNIGDRIPDVQLKNIINYTSTTASLRSFNKKPLLLQFWSAECGTCISSFRKLDTLQAKFAGRVQFLLVTMNDVAKTKQLFREHRVISKTKLVTVAGDSVLWKRYFPLMSVPHEVWVDIDGKVVAITDYKDVNEANLEILATGGKLNLKEKRESNDWRVFYTEEPLISYDYDRYAGDVYSYSFIGGPREGIALGARYDTRDSIKRAKVINSGIKMLYEIANMKYNNHPTLSEWRPRNGMHDDKVFCYDLLLRTDSIEGLFSRMRNDLDRQFGLTSRIEKRMMPCYVLQVDSTKGIQPSKCKKSEKTEGELETEYCALRFWGLINLISRQSLPLIDETGYKRDIDIVLPNDIENTELLKQYLARAGLKLVKAERLLEVVVIE